MQDFEKQYPQRRHSNGHRRSSNNDSTYNKVSDGGMSDTLLPPNGLRYALIIGGLAGLLSILQSVVVTLVNSSTFQQAAKDTSVKQLTGSETLVAGLGCLTFVVSLLICVVAGYIVGKVAVQRRLGFYAGALSGGITYLASFLVRYLPDYPDHLASTTTSGVGMVAGGLLVSLILLLVWSIIGGLLSLWGTWIATRKHPYYVGYEVDEES